MARNGGLIGVDDLAQYRAIERRPLTGRYRDHQIYSAPPPVSTGATLIETLQILQNYQPKAGATVHDRRRLSPLRHRGVAGARSGSTNCRPGAVGRHARTASRAWPCGKPLQAYRSGQGLSRSAGAACGCAARADRPRDHGVCRRRCRRQHDRGYADAEHMGRHVLRVRRPGLPL